MIRGATRAVLAVSASVLFIGCSTGGDATPDRGRAPAPAPASVATSTTAPAAPTTVAVNGPVVDAAGAFLQPLADQSARRLPSPGDCAALAAPNADVRCTRAGDLLAVREEGRDASRPLQVTVFRVGGDRATAIARYADPDRGTVSEATVRSAELDGRPGPGLAVGFRSLGSGSNLELDLLDGAGVVTAHRSYDKGRAVLSQGTVDGWAARFGPDDPNCCPSAYHHEHLVFDGVAWHLEAEEDVPAAGVPAGDFP